MTQLGELLLLGVKPRAEDAPGLAQRFGGRLLEGGGDFIDRGRAAEPRGDLEIEVGQLIPQLAMTRKRFQPLVELYLARHPGMSQQPAAAACPALALETEPHDPAAEASLLVKQFLAAAEDFVLLVDLLADLLKLGRSQGDRRGQPQLLKHSLHAQRKLLLAATGLLQLA